jgi:heme ABC exporter ATP-binding subunit CcmA
VTTNTIAIEANGLCRVFGSRVVLSQVDLRVAAGECVALTGANGAGKTTLLRCLAGALRPSAGEVRWFGRLAGADAATRRLLGMVAHESFLYPHLTVRENLVFAARMCGLPDPLGQADRWLDSVGLRPHAHRPSAQLSKGMRQRLAVVRALVHDPPILLLDEPFSALDAAGSQWLLGLLLELRGRGRTVCFTTHDPQKARLLSDRVFCLQSGGLLELAAGGSPWRTEDLPTTRAA